MTDFTDYYGLLRRIHENLQPVLYLEIGVYEGHSLAMVRSGTRTVGIDPEPKIDSPPPGTTIVATTSDDFFARPDLGETLGGSIDLAFVDGLHLCEQTLRDIANVEHHCAPGAVVLVHDCLPIDETTSSPHRSTVVWSGDVWKAIVALRRHRPDLSIHTIDVAPTGLAVITGLDPTCTTLFDRFDEIIADVADLTFDDLMSAGCDKMLSVVPPNWDRISELILRRPTV